MVFLFVLLIMFFIILTIKIKLEIKNFEFNSQEKEHIRKNYLIQLTIYTFKFIPIFRFKITNKKIIKTLNNEKVKEKIKQQKKKIIEKRKDIDIRVIKELKNIKIRIDEMNLNILIGTEDATTTAFIIPAISTIIAIFLSQKVEKYNEKQKFSIKPIYINQNLINIEFSGIFQFKLIHIINTICMVKKKRKGEKNERTSNRRSYDYSYE